MSGGVDIKVYKCIYLKIINSFKIYKSLLHSSLLIYIDKIFNLMETIYLNVFYYILNGEKTIYLELHRN